MNAKISPASVDYQVKMWSFWNGEDSGFDVPSKQECDENLQKLKSDMMKAFSYSQGACC